MNSGPGVSTLAGVYEIFSVKEWRDLENLVMGCLIDHCYFHYVDIFHCYFHYVDIFR